jgi:hypothetical protein
MQRRNDMYTTLISTDTASTANAETTPYTLPVWPLPATLMPNAHLTWTEWCARLATSVVAAEHIAAAEQIVRTAREPIGAAV